MPEPKPSSRSWLWRRETPAVSQHEFHPQRAGGIPATCRSALSIAVTRQLATVVVTLDGPLEEETCPVLRDVLWDLVVGQGNLSVAVDAHNLVVSDPAVMAVFTALRHEAAHRGGTLAVLEPFPLPAPPAGHPAGTPLDFSRARRSARRAMAEHPAGGAPGTHPNHERSAG